MHNYISKLLLISLIICIAITFISCDKNTQRIDNTTIFEESTIIYDQEVVDDKYLKEKISDATSIYYKSTDDGLYGDENSLFERTILPSIYTEVEYIQSNGNQYIDSNIKYNENLSFELKFSDYSNVEKTSGIFGTDGYLFSLTRYKKAQLVWCVDATKSYHYDSYSPYKTYSIKCSKNELVVNENKAPVQADTGIYGNSNIYIFKSHLGYASLKLYSFKIFDNKILVRNYIPCYRNQDGMCGLYDLVSNQFFTNVYGSNFSTKSSDKIELVTLPNEYQQVEYIQSTGSQYINVGNISGGMICKYKANWQTPGCVISTHMANDPYERNYGYLASFNSKWELGYGNLFPSAEYDALENTDYEVEFSTKYYDAYLKVNNYTLLTSSGQSLPTSNSIIIFANTYSLTNLPEKGTTKAKLYYAQIYDSNDCLIKHLIPCIRTKDSKPGLYDLVANVFYTNIGTGEFLTGNIISKNNIFNNNYLQDFNYDKTTQIYSNKAIDNRTYFDFQVQTFNDNNFISTLISDVDIQSGKHTYVINTYNLSNETTHIRIKHNGEKNDITIGFIPIDKTQNYRISFTALKTDPTTIGGIEIKDIIVEEYEYQTNTSFILPQEYTKNEYIESTGTQYINTGVTPSNNTSIEIKFSMTYMDSRTTFLLGAGKDWCENSFEIYPWDRYLVFNIGSTSITTNTILPNTPTTILITNNCIYNISDGIYSLIGEYQDIFISPVELYLFALNRNGQITSSDEARIYYCKIYDGEQIIRNFIPVTNNQSSTSGLYDLANEVFYSSESNETFLTEKEVYITPNETLSENLPKEYTRLEYLQSTGNQWINPLVKVKEDSFIDADIMFDKAYDYNMMFGTWPTLAFSLHYANQVCMASGLTECQNADASIQIGERYNIKLGQGLFAINNKFQTFGLTHSMPSNSYFILFGASAENLTELPYKWSGKYGCGKIYSFKIYEGNMLVRYFLPCLRNNDSKPGLFDLVENKFYTNCGSDDFLYPVESSTSKEINADNLVAWYIFDGNGEDSSNYCQNSFDYNSGFGKYSNYCNFVSNKRQEIGINQLNNKYNGFSISAWYMFPNMSYLNFSDVFSLECTDGEEIITIRAELYKNSSNQKCLLFVSNCLFTPDSGASSIVIQDDEWIHIAYVVNETQILTYVNGCLFKEFNYIDLGFGKAYLTGILGLGPKSIEKASFYINDFRLFDDALTEKEIRLLASETTLNYNDYSISDFEILESIEMNGSQYIDLNISGDAKYTFDIQFSSLQFKQTLGYDVNNGNCWGINKNGYYESLNSWNIQAGNRDLIIDEYKNGITNKFCNGTLVYSSEFYSSSTYKIGALSKQLINSNHCIIYNINVEKDGNIISNLIPVKNKTSGDYGLFDTINNYFYFFYSSSYNFNHGDIVGHYYDNGTIVKATNEKQDGEIIYTCKICGKQFHKHIESFSYTANFEYDEGIEYIKVFNGYDLSTYEITKIAYTKNQQTNNYSRIDGIVYFEIIYKDGYELDNITTQGSLCSNISNNVYCISQIKKDIICSLSSKKKNIN